MPLSYWKKTKVRNKLAWQKEEQLGRECESGKVENHFRSVILCYMHFPLEHEQNWIHKQEKKDVSIYNQRRVILSCKNNNK